MIVRAAAMIAVSLLTFLPAPAQQTLPASANPAARSMEHKLEHIKSNGEKPKPDPAPTVLTDEEVNAYANSGALPLPKGIQRVHVEATPGAVTADLQVDFDQVTQNSRSSNPLLALFSGVHNVQVSTHAHGERGVGYVHVDRVMIDGVEVPEIALEFFIDRFIKPKHPELGLDSRIALPERIDSAVIGSHKVTLVQK